MIRWVEGGRRRSKGGFQDRELAERVLAKIRGEIALGRAGLPPDPRQVPALADLAPDWLARRALTHKTAKEDGYRWDKHLKPYFGHLRPGEVDHAAIRRFAEAKLAEGLASGSVRLMVALLSSLFVDLVERGLASTNPGRGLPRSLSRILRPSHDPKTTPFLERMEDVRAVFLALPEPLNIAFALGSLAGLRPGEAFALRWEHLDLGTKRIHLRESVTGTLKDKESRVVPILNALLPILAEWKLKTGGTGLVCPPLRSDGRKIYKGTRSKTLRAALKSLGLERKGLGWYEATRHTFASQWVMSGGSIEKLKEILGHYSVVMTERYAHLRPELFTPGDHAVLGQGLLPQVAPVAQIAPGVAPIGHPPASSTA